MEQLNPEQLKAVKHKNGPILIVAGAGTGKTRVITERIKYLISEGLAKPKEILALTFTDKGAEEMLGRVDEIMPLGYEEPWVTTFHSFADRFLRLEGLEIGLDPNFKILTSPEAFVLFKKHLFEFGLKYFLPLGNPNKFIDAILTFFSRLQDENIWPEEFLSFQRKLESIPTSDSGQARMTELSNAYQKYQEIKIKESQMDFGDLILWTIKLLKERPLLLEKYKKQFKYILLDEFQDTNFAQFELIQLLAPADENPNLMVVGDDSQSIYKFRGAAVSNILEFMDKYKNAEKVYLLNNYRSLKPILDSSYKLIKHNDPDTLEAKLGIKKDLVSMRSVILAQAGIQSSVIPAQAGIQSSVILATRCRTVPGSPESEVKMDSGVAVAPQNDTAPTLLLSETSDEEAQTVCSKIVELVESGKYACKDIVILARANNHLEIFTQYLKKYKIPYQLASNRGLFSQPEITGLINFLRSCANLDETLPLYSLLNSEYFDYEHLKILKALNKTKEEKNNLFVQIEKDPYFSTASVALKKAVEENKNTPVSEILFDFVESSKYPQKLMKEESLENNLKLANLDKFFRYIREYEHKYKKSDIPNFVEYLDLMEEAGENPAQAVIEDVDAVTLMTVHAAKGLEFGVVFLVNAVSDRFPSRNRKDVIEVPEELIKESLPEGDYHIQEERRLFYVAMTRAKDLLFFTMAKNYGGVKDKRPSPFLAEAGIDVTAGVAPVILARLLPRPESEVKMDSGVAVAPQNDRTTTLPTYISYSQIDTFSTCPLKYRYRYILSLPTKPNHNLTFGNCVHKTLKEFHEFQRQGRDLKTVDIVALFTKNFDPTGYDTKEHRDKRFEQGKIALKKYQEIGVDKFGIPKFLEEPFKLRYFETPLIGKIDRIDYVGGNYEIVDYKTGTSKDQKNADKDEQLTIYALAVRDFFNIKATKLSFYYIEEDLRIDSTRTEEELQAEKEAVAKSVAEIKKSGFAPKTGIYCNYCDFRKICPAYKNY